jgi:hypothetical protein
MKNAHLLRCSHPSSLRRTFKYASLLRISGALHLGIFDQPVKDDFPSKLLKINNKSNLLPPIPSYVNPLKH